MKMFRLVCGIFVVSFLLGWTGVAPAQLALPAGSSVARSPNSAAATGEDPEALWKRRDELRARAAELARLHEPVSEDARRAYEENLARLEDLKRKLTLLKQVSAYLSRNEPDIISFNWATATGAGFSPDIRVVTLTTDALVRIAPAGNARGIRSFPKGTLFVAVAEVVNVAGDRWTALWLQERRPGFVPSAILEVNGLPGERP